MAMPSCPRRAAAVAEHVQGLLGLRLLPGLVQDLSRPSLRHPKRVGAVGLCTDLPPGDRLAVLGG